MEQRKRGRPPGKSGAHTGADGALARTVWQLHVWGYPLEPSAAGPGVFEVVGLAARNVLGRGDSLGQALGAKRIEQLYREWVSGAASETKLGPDSIRGFSRKPAAYKAQARRARAPAHAAELGLQALAELLLRNSGAYPRRVVRVEPPMMTPDEAAAAGMLNPPSYLFQAVAVRDGEDIIHGDLELTAGEERRQEALREGMPTFAKRKPPN